MSTNASDYLLSQNNALLSASQAQASDDLQQGFFRWKAFQGVEL